MLVRETQADVVEKLASGNGKRMLYKEERLEKHPER